MMWTPLRSPKMYGFIRGFQRCVWWPKCAPASSNCCIVTTLVAMGLLLPVLPRRSRSPIFRPAPVWWLRLWDARAPSGSLHAFQEDARNDCSITGRVDKEEQKANIHADQSYAPAVLERSDSTKVRRSNREEQQCSKRSLPSSFSPASGW